MKTTHIAGAVALLAAVGVLSYLAGTRSTPSAPGAPVAMPQKGPTPRPRDSRRGPPAPRAEASPSHYDGGQPALRRGRGGPARNRRASGRDRLQGRPAGHARPVAHPARRFGAEGRFRARPANLTLSRSKHERALDLLAKGFISTQAKDEAENNLKVAQADAELAAARLAKTEIRAPFGGIIGLRSVSVGDYVKEGQDIVNLEEVDPLKVDFRVPEVYLSQVKSGQVLQITMDALPDRTWPGQVYAINPLVDANGRAIAIRAQVPNADGKLRPGMFARVRLLTSDMRDSLMVPEVSIFPVGDDKYVFKVVDDRAQRQKVDIGRAATERSRSCTGSARPTRSSPRA